MSLPECLHMEFNVLNKFKEEKDFYTGVKSQLVTKDKSPKWRHGGVFCVSEKVLDSFFQGNLPLNLDIEKYEYPGEPLIDEIPLHWRVPQWALDLYPLPASFTGADPKPSEWVQMGRELYD